MIAVNILMLCSIPVDGGHYFTDMLGGAVLGIAAIVFAAWLIPLRQKSDRLAR